MPITKSAQKAIRVARRRRVHNLRNTRAIQLATKELRKMHTVGKKDEAVQALSRAYQAIDKAAKRGVLKKNTAARRKSRLARLLKNV